MSAGTGTANIAVLMSPAPSPVSVNLVSSWQETTDLASVSANGYKTHQSEPMSLKSDKKVCTVLFVPPINCDLTPAFTQM